MSFRFTFIFAFCLISTLVWSQKEIKTVYFNEAGDTVSTKSEAISYDVIQTSSAKRIVTGYYGMSDVKKQETYYKKDLNRDGTDSIWWQYGPFRAWHLNGKLKTEGFYGYDKLHQNLKTFYSNGQLKREDLYKNDTLVTGHCFDEKGDTVAYFPYRQNPEFKEGQAALFRFLGQNMRYPDYARKKNVEGTVYIGFVVDKEGKIVNIKVKRGVHPSIDEEALRVVKKMPNWIPGKEDGELVRVSYTLPIKFKLE